MDAIDFIRERNRMCNVYNMNHSCRGCPALSCECQDFLKMADDDNIVAIVKQWAAAHPRNTRQSKFLEQWPRAVRDETGCLLILPCRIDDTVFPEGCGRSRNCNDCRHEYWRQGVSDHE